MQAPKLSHNAENKIVENQRRLAIAQQKAEIQLRNEAVKQNTKIKAIELTGLFPHLTPKKSNMWELIEEFEKMLSIEPVEYEEPQQPLDLVKA